MTAVTIEQYRNLVSVDDAITAAMHDKPIVPVNRMSGEWLSEPDCRKATLEAWIARYANDGDLYGFHILEPFEVAAYGLEERVYETPGLNLDEMIEQALLRKRADAEADRRFKLENSRFGVFDPMLVTSIDNFETDTALWTIEGVLPADGLTMLYAEGFAGKTYLALDWSLSVATGTDWHGRSVKPGKVLYMAMEGRSSIRKRAEAWKVEHEIAETPDLHVYPRVVNIMDRDSVAAVARHIESEGYALVVVDTLAKSLGGSGENDQEDAGAALQALETLREASPGASVLYVHHTKKDDRNVHRGSTKWFDDADQVWRMSLHAKDDRENPMRDLVCTKNKIDTDDATKYLMEFAKVGGDSVLRLLANEDADEVLHWLKGQKDKVTSQTVVEAFPDKSEKTVKNRLSALVKAGLVSKHETSPNTYTARTTHTIDLEGNAA